jgi:histone acetyltransferase (RNA polymerase elongator complex component)
MIIPFFIPHAGCPHQCVFCNQKRITGRSSRPDPAAVAGTIEARLESNPSKRPVEVAFYGGSFTAIPAGDQRAYLEAARPFIDAGTVAGIRVSTRPDSINAETLGLLRRHRVSTVELGVQSLDDEVLRSSGRGHRAEDSLHAAALLRQEGFRLGLQIMCGLPGDTEDRFRQTVRQVVALRPDFVRIYPTLVLAGTPLEVLYREGNYAPLALEAAVAQCRDAADAFADAGVTVIRTGLQPTEELERPGAIVAGPWHPAFGEIVTSSRFLARMQDAVTRSEASTLFVHPRDLSAAIGQGRRNRSALRERFRRHIRIAADPSVARGAVIAGQASGRSGAEERNP